MKKILGLFVLCFLVFSMTSFAKADKFIVKTEKVENEKLKSALTPFTVKVGTVLNVTVNDCLGFIATDIVVYEKTNLQFLYLERKKLVEKNTFINDVGWTGCFNDVGFNKQERETNITLNQYLQGKNRIRYLMC